jgi:hypothetical protein
MGTAEGFALKNNPNFATDPVWSTFHVEQLEKLASRAVNAGRRFT